jgi:hypothetical protein
MKSRQTSKGTWWGGLVPMALCLLFTTQSHAQGRMTRVYFDCLSRSAREQAMTAFWTAPPSSRAAVELDLRRVAGELGINGIIRAAQGSECVARSLTDQDRQKFWNGLCRVSQRDEAFVAGIMNQAIAQAQANQQPIQALLEQHRANLQRIQSLTRQHQTNIQLIRSLGQQQFQAQDVWRRSMNRGFQALQEALGEVH